jgi:16S rRNA (guanine966-N2)-methyltransferase
MRIIAGEYRSRRIHTPDNDKTRPTTDRSRESLFNVLENLMDLEGIRVLDLFAGSGAVAFEALSRGAEEAVLVEKDRTAINSIRINAEDLEVEGQVKVISKDAYQSVSWLNGDFDLIFVDAPYRDIRSITELPKMLIESNLLRPNAIIAVEHSSHNQLTLPEGAKLIKNLKVGEATFTIFARESSETPALDDSADEADTTGDD